jgi:voltage-gated potassium channel
MNEILYKLFLGKKEYNFILPNPAIKNQLLIIKRIWNNEERNDVGLEKLFRLFLASVQFIFPAVYMRHLLWKKGYIYQTVAIEIYVISKTLLPILLLYLGLLG